MSGLANLHGNFANPTKDSLFCETFFLFGLFLTSLPSELFLSHQKLMSCFAFCSIGCFLASRGLYLITVSLCVDTLSAASQQNPCAFLLCSL